MKLTLGIFLTLVAGALSQTVTDGLLSAQADLALGHEFFETAFFLNRGQVSSYLYRINREIIDSHINTYEFIKTLGLETSAEIEAIEVNDQNRECVNSVQARWGLQMTR